MKDLANEIRDNCDYCKRFKARTIQTEMGKQHGSRLTSVLHKLPRANVAVYGAVFKDLSSGAIAVYVMPGKAPGAFLNCYTRYSPL